MRALRVWDQGWAGMPREKHPGANGVFCLSNDDDRV